MRCKDVERMIIDDSEGLSSCDGADALSRHLSGCRFCAEFRKDLEQIRKSLDFMAVPYLSEELAEKTRALCSSVWRDSFLKGYGARLGYRLASIPGPIWLALFFLIILTGIGVILLLSGYEAGEPLSSKSVLAITLLAQNVVMLFFAPVLIPRFYSRWNGFHPKGGKK